MGLLGTTLRRLTVAVAALSLVCAAGACGSGDASSVASSSSPATSAPPSGSVAMFTPSDGITLSNAVPLNRWNQWSSALAEALHDEGFTKDTVSSVTSSSLEDQSRDIQDYVVDHVNAADSTSSPVTLVVAPAVAADESSRYYGDYVAQPTPVPSTGDTDSAESGKRLVAALKLAKRAGMHVVLVANTVDGFTPDAFVNMASAEEIGRMQAQQIVAKLQLDSATKSDPKHVEILLPYDGESDADSVFAARVFTGAWKVLEPYFHSGVVISPSGRLTDRSTTADWQRVAFAATKSDQVTRELRDRLVSDEQKDPVRIDGVIAMNDFVASGVVDELTKLGYTGSAADVNPSITISGIINSLSGRQDLDKSAVPDPSAHSGEQQHTVSRTAWPIVTGYGAYTSNLPNIVAGKQWVTGFADRDLIAKDTAKICATLDNAQEAKSLDFMTTSTVNRTKVATLQLPLVPVSAQNLKAELIDPGYVSLADAGL